MVLPLYDDNPFKLPRPPLVTWLLIAANAVVFLSELAAMGSDLTGPMLDNWAVIPAHIAHPPDVPVWRTWATLVTATFLHGGWDHILGNMIYLFVFGDDIEEALGPFRYLAFYLLVGIAANLGYVAFNADSAAPLIGASGAISGVLAAYLMLRPCAHVTVIFTFIAYRARVRAYWPIGGWILLQLYYFATDTQDGVAYLAHLGGLLAGAMLFVVLKPAGVALFECIPQAGEETASSGWPA
jgi:membrane associated rhomboid family serine protease